MIKILHEVLSFLTSVYNNKEGAHYSAHIVPLIKSTGEISQKDTAAKQSSTIKTSPPLAVLSRNKIVRFKMKRIRKTRKRSRALKS